MPRNVSFRQCGMKVYVFVRQGHGHSVGRLYSTDGIMFYSNQYAHLGCFWSDFTYVTLLDPDFINNTDMTESSKLVMMINITCDKTMPVCPRKFVKVSASSCLYHNVMSCVLNGIIPVTGCMHHAYQVIRVYCFHNVTKSGRCTK